LVRLADYFAAALFASLALGALDIALLCFALGGLRALLSHHAAVGLLGVWALVGLVGLGIKPQLPRQPEHSYREPAWVFPALFLLPFATLFVSAWCERHGVAVLPGGAPLAWTGVAVAGVGAGLRVAAASQLGRLFSPFVVLQRDHALTTTGLYGRLRHPAYLGALLSACGAALTFRSGVGLVGAVALAFVLRVRVGGEERLLAERFGEAFAAYRARTGRLWPRLGRRPAEGADPFPTLRP
jgi:protein-S-isoprenylcysteine O-methyltransferase Ste14